MNVMELRVLKYFLAVANEENITHAAEKLNITQPTLSRQLKQLEDELSAQLFYREKNKMLLTEQGMFLKRRAEDLIGLVDKTEKEFLQQDQMITGEIYFGAGELNSMHLLAKEMKQFKEQYPLVKYHMYSGNADDIKEKLEKGLVDIALLAEPVDIDKYEYIRLNQKDLWGILVNKDDPIANKEYVSLEDIKNKPLIISQRTLVQKELSRWFQNSIDELNIVSTYNLIHNASIMVEEGLGYALCLENLITTSSETKLQFIPLYPSLYTGSVIVWRKNQLFTQTKMKFIEQLKSTNAF